MGSESFVQLIIIIAVLAIYVIPVVKILRKAGYSGWWCIAAFVPIVNLIMLWVFAFADWPNLRPNVTEVFN